MKVVTRNEYLGHICSSCPNEKYCYECVQYPAAPRCRVEGCNDERLRKAYQLWSTIKPRGYQNDN